MLEIVQIQNRKQIAEIFKGYDPRKQAWVVSDVRTKFEIQRQILHREGQFVDESVLRASDLWRLLLKRLDPHVRLVSDAFAKSLLKSIMDLNSAVLGVNSSAAETVFSYIDQLAPILLHPEGVARLEEWFENHPQSKGRWRDWYLRARFCALKLLHEQRVITSDWIPAYLQNFTELEKVWNTSLIVDLGGEISGVEAELFRALSRFNEILVLEPSPSWKDEYFFLMQPYADLQSQGKVRTFEKYSIPTRKKIEVLRFSGMLAEIKNCVGQVREWLDEGKAVDSIAIIAPDIETYWPVLGPFLQEEGVGTQKDVTHKLQSIPSVVRWMAALRSRSGRLTSSDLEISFYNREESRELRYEKFRSLYKSLYESEDLIRNEIITKMFTDQLSSTQFLKRDEFVAKALIYWGLGDIDTVQIILKELLQNASASTQLTWGEWLKYLESIVSSKERIIEKGEAEGVLVTKVMSAHSEKSKYRIFLGLTDEALRIKGKTQLSGQDYASLGREIGFYLENPDQSDVEFDLRLVAEMESFHDIYCFGVTDLKSSICAPSNFWLSFKQAEEQLNVPKVTRWDEVQNSDNCGFRIQSKLQNDIREMGLDQDSGKIQLENMELSVLPRLSPSSLESFLKCPFTFAAQKYFKLKNFPDVDLDVDHRTRGQLAHAIFEKLTVEPMRFDWTEQEVLELLETIRLEKEMIFADERLWLPLKKKHAQLALRFLAFENTWREQFALTETVAREKKFEFYIDSKTQAISREFAEGSFRVSGQIDRIDSDRNGELVIIDYKSSQHSTSGHASWLKKSELQLLFYMWVLEKDLIEGIGGEVIGLFYYIIKGFERKGFQIEEKAGRLFPHPDRRSKNANLDVKEKYLQEFQEILFNTSERIRSGEYAPKPNDIKNCSTCEWSRQCRATHLS